MKANMPGGRGRPATMDYIHASGLTRDNADISRIVTDNGAIHSVRWDHEMDEYVIRWESKADQKSVVLSLLRTIAQYRQAALDHGANVEAIDAEMDSTV